MKKIKAIKLSNNPRRQFRIGGVKDRIVDRKELNFSEEEAALIDYMKNNVKETSEQIAEKFGILPEQVEVLKRYYK